MKISMKSTYPKNEMEMKNNLKWSRDYISSWVEAKAGYETAR